MNPTQKSCSANGNPGCIRGFVRDRCRKCDLGSIACDMCLPLPSPSSTPSSPSSPTALFFKQNTVLNPSQSKNRKQHRVSYTSPLSSHAPNASASVTFMPRRSLSFDPTPTTVPFVNKSRQSLSISPLSSPVSSPTSPVFSYIPSEPSSPIPSSPLPSGPSASSCIYCRNGRRPCEDCFGLGYVQRICQDCIRASHRRHNSSSGISVGIGAITAIGSGNNNGGRRKSSMPSNWNQMGGGWSRFKEQLLQSTSLKTSMPDTPDGAVAQSVVAQGPLQIEKETCQQQHSDLKKFECKKKVEKLPLGLEEILVISSEPTTSAPAPTPASAPSAPSTHVRDSSKSSGRISFKATVMKHLKVPLLFSNSNNTNNNSSDDQTKRSKHHRRQRSISLFMPSLLRAASTAA